KYIAEAVSHEVGHTLGLNHDGTSTVGYYSGQGNWAPIMGVGYYHEVTQWSKGEYADANNTQDDLAIIQGYISYRADDHGNTIGTATPLTGPDISASGVIEKSTDVDMWSPRVTMPGCLQVSRPQSRQARITWKSTAWGAAIPSRPVIPITPASGSIRSPGPSYLLEPSLWPRPRLPRPVESCRCPSTS